MWNASQLQLIPYQPWRWVVEPTYSEPPVTELTPGTKEFLDGVHFLMSAELVAELKAGLSTQDAAAMDSYTVVWTVEEAGMWHVPVWGGQGSATYLRIPKNVWNDPTGNPPQRVTRLMQRLWQEVGNG